MAAGASADWRKFGSNPGALDACVHVPADLAPGAALVVVLHGCTQNAAGYDARQRLVRAGRAPWLRRALSRADRSNNPNLCFNWYSPADARRGRGEALSIRQMVARMVKLHDLDERRIFVTGLSAGGAMTSVMLAAYPDLFAGGAVIAGLPFATANTSPRRSSGCAGRAGRQGASWPSWSPRPSDHRGPWPTLSVWHGSSDIIVDPVNADEIVDQWRALHGVDGAAATIRDRRRLSARAVARRQRPRRDREI